MMYCPKCSLINPDSAQICDCGYNFETKRQEKPIEGSGFFNLKKKENVLEAYFFTTSTFKLSLMSICTFGIYELYWFYKNWVLIKERTGQSIEPFWRAFFSPLWAYSCFKHIRKLANENNIPESLTIGHLAFFYFIFQGLWRLPDPFWLVSLFSFTFILPVNSIALSINNRLVSDFKNNENFSGWNWVIVVLGGLLLVLILIGTFKPEALTQLRQVCL